MLNWTTTTGTTTVDTTTTIDYGAIVRDYYTFPPPPSPPQPRTGPNVVWLTDTGARNNLRRQWRPLVGCQYQFYLVDRLQFQDAFRMASNDEGMNNITFDGIPF